MLTLVRAIDYGEANKGPEWYIEGSIENKNDITNEINKLNWNFRLYLADN